jgi:hypothetical protein
VPIQVHIDTIDRVGIGKKVEDSLWLVTLTIWAGGPYSLWAADSRGVRVILPREVPAEAT